MSGIYITLLVEELRQLANAAGAGRHAALESILWRGSPCHIAARSADHLRLALFGIESQGQIPVAALTRFNDRREQGDERYYWLRTDPVTLWADMARVFMTSHGFADLDPYERNEIENCVRGVLEREGIVLHADHPERWCIALEKPLEFDFTPPDEVLGADIAGALPEHTEARYWRRLLTEIQIALHHSAVNQRRRARGLQEINSVWFWGGGFIPAAARHNPFDAVYSDHPVSRGLAIINDCRLQAQARATEADFKLDGRSILIDWRLRSRDPEEEMARLERLARLLLGQVHAGELVLRLCDGSGRGRVYDRGARRRFWRRRKPLIRALPEMRAA